MPFTGHVRKRETKSGITSYQIIVEEESTDSSGKRKRYYKTIKGNKKDASFFEYLETQKPDKIYSLFGKGYLVFEKDGKRNLINRKRQISDLPAMYEEFKYDLDHFNHYDFPRDRHTPLMIDYSKD